MEELRVAIPVNPDALPDHIVNEVRRRWGQGKMPPVEEINEFVYAILELAHRCYGLPDARKIWLVDGVRIDTSAALDINLVVRGSSSDKLQVRPDPGGGYRATHGDLNVTRPTAFEASVAIGEMIEFHSRKTLTPWAKSEWPIRGFYVHYKGGIYFVQSRTSNEDNAQTHVIYESVQGVNGVTERSNIRSIDEFMEYVDAATGGTPDQSTKVVVPRFMRVMGWDHHHPLVNTPEGLRPFGTHYGTGEAAFTTVREVQQFTQDFRDRSQQVAKETTEPKPRALMSEQDKVAAALKCLEENDDG